MATNGSIFDVVTSDKDLNFSEAICSICDNGGELICCEGKCLRSFHATVEDGIESACDSLDLSEKIMKEGTFTCENCQYNQHQCYVCGKLGSSDKSAGAEVFQCGSRACGYFYHPSCVANAFRFLYEDEPKDVGAEIASGKPFICPLHFCYACKQKEQEDEASVVMQFAVCRRCPIAYHRKCLPGNITFEDDGDEGIITRAWDDLIPNKILLYCMEHVIDEDLQTPHRYHLKFPYTNLKQENQDKESVAEGLSKRTFSKPSECSKSEKLLEEGQVEKLSLRRRRFSRSYSSREPKRRFASKTTLHKSSSSMSYSNYSGLYSFRDRKMVTKYRMVSLLSGLKKKVRKDQNNSSSKTSMDAVLNNSDSSSDSAKRRTSSNEVTACDNDSVVSSKLENQESSGSGTNREGSEKIAAECENDSLATILENQHINQSKIIKEDAAAASIENPQASGSEKKRKSSINRPCFGSSKKRSKIIEKAAPLPIVFALSAQGSEHFEKLSGSKDSTAMKMESHVSPGSEKISRSSKEVEASGISGSEKQRERFKELAACNNDTVISKLENQEGSCSEKKRKSGENRVSFGSIGKQSKIIKEVAPVSGASKLENPKASGLKKRCESAVMLAGSKDQMARRPENPKASGSENRSESSVEKLEGSKHCMARKIENPKGSKDQMARRLENPKACGSEKQSETVTKLEGGKDQMARRLENPKACGLEKQRETVTKLAGSKDQMAGRLENPKASGSEKRSESAVKLAGSKDQMARRLENPKASGSEKRSESSLKLAGSKDQMDRRLENPKASGSENRSESAVKLAGSKDQMARRLVNPKASGSEKRSESSVEKLAGSKDSIARNLGNPKACGSEKTSRSIKEVETCGISGPEKPKERLKEVAACYRDSVANKLEKQEISGLEKKRKSSENHHSFGPLEKKSKIFKEVAAVSDASKLNPSPKSSTVSGASKLNPNPKSSGSVKQGENGEKLAAIRKDTMPPSSSNKQESSSKKDGEEKNSSSKTTSTPAHGILSCSSTMNLSSSGVNKSKPFSKSTFKPLDFYTGPWKPPTENNSFGWLT